MKMLERGKLLKLKSPVFLNIDLTSNCDWKCKFCYVGSDNEANVENIKFTPYERFVEIIDRIVEADVFKINIFGGEPLIHPDVLRIAKYAKKKGLEVGTVSNGSRITKDTINELSRYLDGCSLSMHGFEKTHDFLTGIDGSYKKSMESLDMLSKSDIKTGICYTLVNRNLDEFGEFCSFVSQNFPISYFALNRLIPAGKVLDERKTLEPSVKDFNKALKTLKEKKREYPSIYFNVSDSIPYCLIEKDVRDLSNSCSAGITFAALDEHGNLKLCSGSSYVIGNIFEEKLERLWQDSELMEYYRSLEWLNKKCKSCENIEYCLGGCKITRPYEKPFSTDSLVKK